MKLKLQKLALAAAAVLAMGSANAAIDRGFEGNGSLFLLAFDNINNADSPSQFDTTGAIFDLGYYLNDFASPTGNGTAASTLGALAAAGTSIVWDFKNNTVTLNGAAVTTLGTNDWTAAYNVLMANSDAIDMRFAVGANDTTGFGTAKRSLFTGSQTPSDAQLLAQNNVNTGNMAIISVGNDIFTPVKDRGTIGSADNGAYTFTAADGATTRANGYVVAGDAFANDWRNANKMQGVNYVDNPNQNTGINGFWLGDGTGAERLLGTMLFNAQLGTLTFEATAVPEASTYASMLLGLCMMGGLAAARRRR